MRDGPTGESLEETVEFDIAVLLVIHHLDEDVYAAVDDGGDVPHLAAGEGGRYDTTHILPALVAEVDQSVGQRAQVHTQTGSVNEIVKLFDEYLASNDKQSEWV